MRVETTEEFQDWIDSLKDLAGRGRILVGGDKSSQKRDIKRAFELNRLLQDL